MEKIKKYNQIVLAIGGTVALVTLAGIGLFLLVETWHYYFDDYDDSQYDMSIISEEVADSLANNEQLRTQVITFRSFDLIDSAKAIYILPVTQKNLGEAEYIDEGALGLMNSRYTGRKTSLRIYGVTNYNNLILFGPNISEPKMLFEEKVSIDGYHYLEELGSGYVLIIVAESDSNGDGVLNGYDNQSLFLYDMQTSSFIDIAEDEHTSFVNFVDGVDRTELIFQYGFDRNKNGVFESSYEPKVYYRLNIEAGRMELLLPNEMLDNLQGILEGSTDNEE